jgi:ceramide glucosyltransferase
MTQAVALAFFIVAVASAFYLALAIARLLGFAYRPLELAFEFLPTVTILKPIAGLEPDLYENLASFCDQEYPQEFDVIFCLHSPDDPARPIAERVARDFPSAHASIALGENPAIANPKIANLVKPSVDLRGEIVVIADSDIRVDRRYLRALATSFASERTGATTCLYSGMPNATLVARLGALQIEDGFIPSVLVAIALGKLRFCLGATMAVRRSVLVEIGGLAALGDQLADDHALGEMVTGRGYEVELSRYVVKTTVAETTLRDLWSHELRWARTNLALAPAGYAFSFLMYALPLALLYLIAVRNLAWGLPLLAVVLALRAGLHYAARAALSVSHPSDLSLVPLRDFLSVAVWAASFFGRSVRWRTQTYRTGRL